ncbi:hypothetical protein D3C75_989440 [compost metagenome]
MGRRHRTFTALEPQVQACTVVTGRADRQRLLAPFRQAQQGTFRVHFQADTQDCPGFWQHFERDFGDQPEAAVTAGHQA